MGDPRPVGELAVRVVGLNDRFLAAQIALREPGTPTSEEVAKVARLTHERLGRALERHGQWVNATCSPGDSLDCLDGDVSDNGVERPTFGDLTGDGQAEAIGRYGHAFTVLSPNYTVIPDQGVGWGVAIGRVIVDIDQDGTLDLVHPDQQTYVFRRNQGDGTFAAPLLIDVGPLSPHYSAMAAGDFNHDGVVDFLTEVTDPNVPAPNRSFAVLSA